MSSHVDPKRLLAKARRAGIAITLGADGQIALRGPASDLEHWRTLVAKHRAALVIQLQRAEASRSSRCPDRERDVKKPLESTSVPPVPLVPPENGTGASVPLVPSEENQFKTSWIKEEGKDGGLSGEVLGVLNVWLDAIGETDPQCRAEYLEACAANPEHLRYALKAAADLSRGEAA